MVQLVNIFLDSDGTKPKHLSLLEENSSSKRSEISVKLPEAMPLSCSSTHLHRFDNIETTSEPKVIYMDKTWYK